MKTIKVNPWGKDQGEFVLINEVDFDPEVHELYGEKKLSTREKKAQEATAAAAAKLEETRAALTAKGITFEPEADQEALQALLDAAV